MLNSNRIVFGILGFVLLMGLTSCWEPTKQKSNLERGFSTANFLVKLVDGDALPTEEVTPNWLIPKSRHYHFWSCLRNRATDQIIRGIGFTVKSDDSKIEVVTDNEGCLHWHEKIDFDYLAEEAYLQLERTVSGTGIYQGEQKIQLAINPWVVSRKSGLKEVKWERDSQGTDIPDGIKIIGKNQVKSVLRGAYNRGSLPSTHVQGQKLLWMNRVSSNIKEIKQDAQGVWLQIQLSMIPVAQFRDLSGSPNPIPLKAGRFRVDAQIVATNLGVNRDENLILTPDLPPSIGLITNNDGILRVQFDSMITRRVTRGNIQLALRVTPIDGAPEGLGSFEGLYELSPFDKLESRNTDMFVPASVYSEGDGFAYEKFLKSASNFEKLEAARSAFKNEPFEFPKMLIKFETIRPGETATTRTVDYSIQACVRNTLTSSFVKDELFYVDYLPDSKTLELEKDFYTHENEMNSADNVTWCGPDGSSPKSGQACRPLTKTDQDGCLRIMGHVTHKYYKPEELFFPIIRIRHVASSFSKKLVLAINPWDLFATFGRDRRELTDDYVEASKRREKIASLLYVPAFSYHTLRFRYEIDEFMNLVVKKVLLLKLEPKVLRYSSITDGRKNVGQLRDGIYLLKLAVQKDYLDPAAEGVVIGFDEDQKKTYVEAPEKAKTREYINGIKKLVRVQNGEIITPVEIAVRDLRLLRIRSNMLIQLETIDEKKLTMSAIVHANTKEHLSKGDTEWGSIDQRDKLLTDMTYSLSSFLWAGRQEGNLLVPRKNEGNLPGVYQITSKKYLAEIDHLNSGMTPEFLSKMKAEAVQAYKTNDVSFMPVAPHVELDSLRDLDSGLTPRSFSGPVTLLLNSNMSYIRPLDNLDESFCEATDDCREVSKTIDELTGGERAKIEDRDYRDSPLFGSIRHLKSINVDAILQRMTVLEEEYRKNNTISSLLYNFVNQTGLEYVSLGDIPLRRFDQEKCSSLREYSLNEEKCLVPAPEVSTSFENFLSDLNNQGHDSYYQLPGENVNRGDIEKLIETGEIEPHVDSRFCDLFGRQMTRLWKEWDPRGLTVVADWLKNIGWACVDRQRSHDGVSVGFFSLGKRSPGLIFERKLKVLKTGRYRFKGGKPMNISVGVNFGVNYNKSFSGGWNYNIFGEIPILGSILRFFSLKEERTRSNTNGTSIGEGAYLAMQEATMDVEILEHEKCLIVRPHPDFVEPIIDRVNFNVKDVTMRIRDRVKFKMGLSKLDHGKTMSPGDDSDVSEKELVLRQFLRGIMLCGGKKIKEPTPVREKYYYFSQHFTEGDLLDSADLYNHPWLLALRGKRDFQGFMAVIKAVPYNWNFSEVAKAEGWSIDHMIRSYRQVHPTFPGLYSILDEEQSSASTLQYPSQDKPSDSFRNGALDGKKNSEEKAP